MGLNLGIRWGDFCACGFGFAGIGTGFWSSIVPTDAVVAFWAVAIGVIRVWSHFETGDTAMGADGNVDVSIGMEGGITRIGGLGGAEVVEAMGSCASVVVPKTR